MFTLRFYIKKSLKTHEINVISFDKHNMTVSRLKTLLKLTTHLQINSTYTKLVIHACLSITVTIIVKRQFSNRTFFCVSAEK